MGKPVANTVLVPREALAKFVHQYEQEFDPEAVDESRPQWIKDALSVAPQPSLEGEVGEMVELLLDAQQDINLSANETMSQPLADASALIDKVENLLRTLSADNARLREERDQAEVSRGAASKVALDAIAAQEAAEARIKALEEALRSLIAAEDRFVQESGVSLDDPVADAVAAGRQSLSEGEQT